MTNYDLPSRCSGPGAPTFRWYGYPSCDDGEDVRVAVDRLMASISGGKRVWNPYAAGMARSEFKKRIEKAQRGELQPVDEVKPVDVKNPPPLYEIRWTGISVTEREGDGTQSHSTAQVRMYHSEPSAVPDHFVGHHVHEKRLDVKDVNGEQQKEIRAAINWYAHGEPSNWGIATSLSAI